ncbi:glycosyltransferase [Selenomonas ruminantium]|uniref:glycosyltransferase n=1 Tax=Selenomonas ruminantium TaxID=971 RepID=UPI0026ECF674|nr:glycosyltransferase [Selenomonas ruminantium]
MLKSYPLISIITAVYNSEKYIRETIDSVYAQNYANFEFIFVNDCSYDKSVDIIKSYNDDRFIVIENEKNMGASFSRNEALKYANGIYACILDSDDISYDKRFIKQVSYLQDNPNVDICGSYAKMFGKYDYIMKKPLDDQVIKSYMITTCPFIHSTCMIRISSLRKYNLLYDTSLKTAEDYDLWCRAAQYMTYHNIPEVLVGYRSGHDHLSSQRSTEQDVITGHIINRNFSNLADSSVTLYTQIDFDNTSLSKLQNDLLLINTIGDRPNLNKRMGLFSNRLAADIAIKKLCIRHAHNGIRFFLWSVYKFKCIKMFSLYTFKFLVKSVLHLRDVKGHIYSWMRLKKYEKQKI